MHANGNDIYTQPQITERCSDLRYTRKRGNMESYDVFYPASIHQLNWYKTILPPLGIHGIPMHRLIGMNKTGFYLKMCASKYGREHNKCRFRYPQHYRRNEPKINAILAVECRNRKLLDNSDENLNRPRNWIRVSQDNVDQFCVVSSSTKFFVILRPIQY